MTDISRRQVIGAGVAAIAAGALGIGAPLVGAPGARADGPTYTSAESLYRRPRFAALRGQAFRLVRGGVGTPVVLREVADLAGAPTGAADQFRLFLSCRGDVPEQGTYSLRRRGFSPTSLFVVPDPGRRGVTAIVKSG